jgi:N-acetylmuramoyl-L-alanine amidase
MMHPRGRHSRLALTTLALALIALLFVPLAGGLAAPLAAPAAAPDAQQVVVTTDRLNVRSGPGLSHPVVRVIVRGDTFTSDDGRTPADGYAWLQLNTADGAAVGWVADEFVSTGTGSDGDVSGAFTLGDRVLTTTRLNFRTGAGTSSGVIRVLATGSTLTLTGGPVRAGGYVWYQGRTTQATGADTGWVIEDGLEMAHPDMPDPTREYGIGDTVRVTTDGLRLRGAPSTSAAVVARLGRGITLTVTDDPVGADGYSWYPVETASGDSGWVASAYLAYGSGSSGGTGDGATAIVDVARLNLRSGAGTSYAVLDILAGGTRLTILDGPVPANGYAWYRVETANGTIGWVIGEGLAR